jgi:hypothetical protein
MCKENLWLRQESWRQLWKGPGAVATYLSIPLPLACISLSPLLQPKLEVWSWWILSINLLLGALLIVIDKGRLCRNHYLSVLRLSATGSRSRVQELGVKCQQIDHFVNTLWFDSELEFRCRRKRLEAVESIVQALDCLSRTAARYGRCGKKVFEANQDCILRGISVFECMALVDGHKEIVGPLADRLKSPPEFDPEGWALAVK